jgi:predicted alpha/beta superfamily hydrolase
MFGKKLRFSHLAKVLTPLAKVVCAATTANGKKIAKSLARVIFGESFGGVFDVQLSLKHSTG